MQPIDTGLVDATIGLHLDIERVSLSVRNEILRILTELKKELILKASEGVDTVGEIRRIAQQLAEIEPVITRYYTDASNTAINASATVAQVSAVATSQALGVAFGGAILPILPTVEYLTALAGDSIIQGAVQRDWWSRQSKDVAFRFKAAVRQGAAAAETNQQIIKRVMDVMDVSRRNAEALVRTSVQTVANEAREAVFAANAGIVDSKEWLAALDRRTCPVCGALDGKRWKIADKEAPKAPAHFRCRCSYVPVTKTFKELGINAPEMNVQRASMNGPVDNTSFEGWLKRQEALSPGFADKTLGKGRAELWRDGKITMDQMIDGLVPLSIDKLKDKYGLA